MVEVDFKGQAFFFVEEVAEAIVVLRYGKGFAEQAVVPAFVIVRPHVIEQVVIAQFRLIDTDVTVGVPFRVITPGKIKFSFAGSFF
jgi:hypothetical protein